MSTGFPQGSVQRQHGLLLVGHGTRVERGIAEFHAVARQVADLASDFVVEPCFLELAEPDIGTAVRLLLERGVRRLTVAPLLLFAAGHAKRDIPAAVRQAVEGSGEGMLHHKAATGGRAAGSELIVDQIAALECHERIVELSIQRYQEALTDRPPVNPADTLLLMVGRGSSDAEAIAAMHRLAALRSERTPVGRVECCFAAAASPGLDAALESAGQTQYRRIVVQPHLLFAGRVLEQIAVAVAKLAERQSQREWLVTPHLGPSPLVAEAIVDLARQG